MKGRLYESGYEKRMKKKEQETGRTVKLQKHKKSESFLHATSSILHPY